MSPNIITAKSERTNMNQTSSRFHLPRRASSTVDAVGTQLGQARRSRCSLSTQRTTGNLNHRAGMQCEVSTLRHKLSRSQSTLIGIVLLCLLPTLTSATWSRLVKIVDLENNIRRFEIHVQNNKLEMVPQDDGPKFKYVKMDEKYSNLWDSQELVVLNGKKQETWYVLNCEALCQEILIKQRELIREAKTARESASHLRRMRAKAAKTKPPTKQMKKRAAALSAWLDSSSDEADRQTWDKALVGKWNPLDKAIDKNGIQCTWVYVSNGPRQAIRVARHETLNAGLWGVYRRTKGSTRMCLKWQNLCGSYIEAKAVGNDGTFCWVMYQDSRTIAESQVFKK